MIQNELSPATRKAIHANEILRKSDWGSLSDEKARISTSISCGSAGSGNMISNSSARKGNAPSNEDLNAFFLMQQIWQGKRETATASATTLDFPGNAAFEELARVRADDRLFLEAVRVLRNRQDIPDGGVLADRLVGLLRVYQEDYGQSLDVESLRTFLVFVAHHRELRRPAITATPDGNLFAEWKGGAGQHFLGVQFMPTRLLRYVAIRPNPQYAALRIRASGIVTGDQFLAELAGHNIVGWAGRPK